MLEIFANELVTEEMKATVRKSFVSMGSFCNADRKFVTYTSTYNQNTGSLHRSTDSERVHTLPKKRVDSAISSPSLPEEAMITDDIRNARVR